MNLNRSLSGVVDLEEANIVSGGDSYGKFSIGSGMSINPTTEDNAITNYMFALLNPLRKVILPMSITKFDCDRLFTSTKVDTLIINGNVKTIDVGGGWDNKFWNIGCIYFPEGIENINFGNYFHSYTRKNKEIYLPSTLGVVDGRSACSDETTVFHCSSLRPDTIKESYNWITSSKHMFLKGTIYIPKGTKGKYEQSIFNNLAIIEDIHVEGVTLESQKSVYVGDEIRLVAEIIPTDALNQNIKWESSNPDIATVSEDGTITALSYGQTDIIATTIDGGFKATCKVYVFEHTTGVEMQDNIIISLGKQIELNAKTLPLSTSDGKITYASNDKNIATISESGMVTGKVKGTCVITATSVDGGYTAECIVTVLQPVESVTLMKHNLNMKVGDTESLYAQVSPSNADNKKIIWSSSDEQSATVSENGEVKALKPGIVWIKAISEDNAEAKDSCKITITQPVTGIQLAHNSFQLNGIGESFELNASVTPADASNTNVKWSSSNESVCVVSNGTVVAVGEGVSVIIATTEEGGYVATCTVTVTIPSSISTARTTGRNPFRIFDVNGVERGSLQQGINIIRFDDGSIKKVYVKGN